MGVIDSIVRKKLITSPEVISSDFTSDFVDISGVEDSYSIQMNYSSGDGSVDMDFTVEVSIDGNTYIPITDPNVLTTITDDSGAILLEIVGRGVNFLRTSFTVRAGQLTADSIEFSGNRRH